MLSITDYCVDPCRAASIPYWKTTKIFLPENMCIVHNSEFTDDLLERYIDEPYFRLKHDLTSLAQPQLPNGFSLCAASFREYSEHIHQCYSDIGISETELRSYAERKVFCSKLLELLHRMKSEANFATVSGQCNNPSSPEQLYRRCGFQGDDIWHILRKTSYD